MSLEREAARKRYLSIVSSLQSMQEQLHVVALEFVTLRRNEAQLCLELQTHNSDSSPKSSAAAVSSIRQRLARQRDSESADMQREVNELLREWGEGSSDGHLTRLDLEAVRSAKKRSLLKEQNEMISQLQAELQQLRTAQITNASASSSAPAQPEALSSHQLSDSMRLEELQRKVDFCETERRSSAILVDSLSQRLAEEQNASQELKSALASVQVDCSIAQVHPTAPSSSPLPSPDTTRSISPPRQDALFRNQSFNARRKAAAVSLCASLNEVRRRLVMSQAMHSWTL